jgi:hypothetical protein
VLPVFILFDKKTDMAVILAGNESACRQKNLEERLKVYMIINKLGALK